jgi:hypothetical protein
MTLATGRIFCGLNPRQSPEFVGAIRADLVIGALSPCGVALGDVASRGGFVPPAITIGWFYGFSFARGCRKI